jgi:hypothetical protein
VEKLWMPRQPGRMRGFTGGPLWITSGLERSDGSGFRRPVAAPISQELFHVEHRASSYTCTTYLYRFLCCSRPSLCAGMS